MSLERIEKEVRYMLSRLQYEDVEVQLPIDQKNHYEMDFRIKLNTEPYFLVMKICYKNNTLNNFTYQTEGFESPEQEENALIEKRVIYQDALTIRTILEDLFSKI